MAEGQPVDQVQCLLGYNAMRHEIRLGSKPPQVKQEAGEAMGQKSPCQMGWNRTITHLLTGGLVCLGCYAGLPRKGGPWPVGLPLY